MPEAVRQDEIRVPEVNMPENIKELFEVAVQAGFKAAKRESDGSYRLIATRVLDDGSPGGHEVWLTIGSDGSRVEGLRVVDPKTKTVISQKDGETVQRWVDLLSYADVNAKEGMGAYIRLEPKLPIYTERSKMNGIGITLRETKPGSGKLQPTSLGLINVT